MMIRCCKHFIHILHIKVLFSFLFFNECFFCRHKELLKRVWLIYFTLTLLSEITLIFCYVIHVCFNASLSDRFSAIIPRFHRFPILYSFKAFKKVTLASLVLAFSGFQQRSLESCEVNSDLLRLELMNVTNISSLPKSYTFKQVYLPSNGWFECNYKSKVRKSQSHQNDYLLQFNDVEMVSCDSGP